MSALIDSLDAFTRHYLIAALWSSTGDDGEPLDASHDLDDIAPETVDQAKAECAAFQLVAAPLLAQAYELYDDNGMSRHPDAGSPQACAGHDFWLTRCGHGVGFWGRGFDQVGTDLTALCGFRTPFDNVDLYIGDDGKIHS